MSDYNSSFSIKSWNEDEDDRPREKLINKGKAMVSDAELIAILIGSGSRNESAVSLSKRILASAENNLNQLGRCTVGDLCRFKGIGEVKAITIIAGLENVGVLKKHWSGRKLLPVLLRSKYYNQ